jgi:hypothetical protein
MNISVTRKPVIWNRRIDIGLLLNFGEHKVEVRGKCGYYLLPAVKPILLYAEEWKT